MKTRILLAVMLIAFLAGSAYSQDDRPPMGPPDRQGPPDKQGPKRSPEEMLKQEMKMLTEELNLTDTQIPFVKKILEDSQKKMQSNMDKESRNFDEMKQIMDERDNNLKLVLTEEQFGKYKDIKSKNKFKMKHDGPPREKE